jgi:GTP-binding protein YchF
MALNCGILGLPNVGKSTIFSALCSTAAEATNYPFSTIKPNIGIINIPDPRLEKLASIFQTERAIPATVEFVDIAGLVRGASKGEGLGNQFLSNIRDAAVYAHVVRCFDDDDIIHVYNKVDPASDIEIINTELALADLQTLAKRRERAEKNLKNLAEKKHTDFVLSILEKINPALENVQPIRSLGLSNEEKAAIYDCHFITAKPQLYVCNVDEKNIHSGNAHTEVVKKIAEAEGTEAILICGKFEADLCDIDNPEEKKAFLDDLGLEETSLSTLIRSTYKLLGLRTYFSKNKEECRAWTIRVGDTAPKAAGVIHTDFEKGFIKADVYTYEDIISCGTEAKIKEAGKYRQEGRDYVVQDGDVILFKFNV